MSATSPLTFFNIPFSYQTSSISSSPSLSHSESDTSLDWSNTDPTSSLRGPPRLTYTIQSPPRSGKGEYWVEQPASYQSAQVAQTYPQGASFAPVLSTYTIIANPESFPTNLQDYDRGDYGDYDQTGVMDSRAMADSYTGPAYTAACNQSIASSGEVTGMSQHQPQPQPWQWVSPNGSHRAFSRSEEQNVGRQAVNMLNYRHPESNLRSQYNESLAQGVLGSRPSVGERRKSRQAGQNSKLQLPMDGAGRSQVRRIRYLTCGKADSSQPLKLQRSITATCEDALYNPAVQSVRRSNFAPPPQTSLASTLQQNSQLQSHFHPCDHNHQLLSPGQANYNPVASVIQQAQAARDKSPLSSHSVGLASAYPFSQTSCFATPSTPFQTQTSPSYMQGRGGLTTSSPNAHPDFPQVQQSQYMHYGSRLAPNQSSATIGRQSVSPKETLLDEIGGTGVHGEEPLFPQAQSFTLPLSSPPILLPHISMAPTGPVGGLFSAPTTFQTSSFAVTSPQRPTSTAYNFVPPNAFNAIPFSSVPDTLNGSSSTTLMQPPPARDPSPPQFRPMLVSMESTRSEALDNQAPSSSQESTSQPSNIPLVKPHPSGAEAGTYTCTYHGCAERFDTPRALQKHKREGHRVRPPHQRPTYASATTRSSTLALSPPPPPPSVPEPSSHGSDDNNGSRSISPYEGTQAGPHTCNRQNPQTGKPCNARFSRPYDLTRHEDTIHNRRKLKIRCEYCTEVEKTFSRRDALTRHLRVVHPEMAENENKRKAKLLGGD